MWFKLFTPEELGSEGVPAWSYCAVLGMCYNNFLKIFFMSIVSLLIFCLYIRYNYWYLISINIGNCFLSQSLSLSLLFQISLAGGSFSFTDLSNNQPSVSFMSLFISKENSLTSLIFIISIFLLTSTSLCTFSSFFLTDGIWCHWFSFYFFSNVVF